MVVVVKPRRACEVDEKRYLQRAEKVHTPVLPLECGRARGIENRDFIREDRHSDRCWVTIATFNSLYPEIAEATDLGATLRSMCVRASRWRIGRGHHSKLCYELPASSSAPQQLWGSLSLPGRDVRSGLPELDRGDHLPLRAGGARSAASGRLPLLRAAGIILEPAVGIALALVTWTRRKKRLA